MSEPRPVPKEVWWAPWGGFVYAVEVHGETVYFGVGTNGDTGSDYQERPGRDHIKLIAVPRNENADIWTTCCERGLTSFRTGAWKRENHHHVWGVCAFSPFCCDPTKATWIRRECLCGAIQWIRRDTLPAGHPDRPPRTKERR